MKFSNLVRCDIIKHQINRFFSSPSGREKAIYLLRRSFINLSEYAHDRMILAIFTLALPSPYNCDQVIGSVSVCKAFAIELDSGCARIFQLTCNVSTHSVSVLTVTQGFFAQYASFCRPPESVTIFFAPFSTTIISK